MWDGCSLRDLAAGKPAQEKTMHSEGLEMQPAPQPGTRRTCQEFFCLLPPVHAGGLANRDG